MSAHCLIRPLSLVVAVTALLLSVPLVAMQFTPEVDWTAGDFVAAACLLLSAGTALVLGLPRVSSPRGKAALIGFALAFLMLVWSHLAVGLLF